MAKLTHANAKTQPAMTSSERGFCGGGDIADEIDTRRVDRPKERERVRASGHSGSQCSDAISTSRRELQLRWACRLHNSSPTTR